MPCWKKPIGWASASGCASHESRSGMTSTTAVHVTTARPAGTARAVIAASIGNMLEWYDFTVYAAFAIYIAHNFFPSNDPSVDLVKTFLAFGVGFVVRPIGAILIGLYGDRAGRKAALTLTILMMAGGTLIIAISPIYAVIGLGAPVLLLTGRVLQGFSAGGEVGGAAAFLVENASPDKKGIYASWLQASMGMSNILGALVALSVTGLLAPEQVMAWGWRIPFAIGLLIAPVGLFLRKTLHETPAFEAEKLRQKAEAQPPDSPLIVIFRDYWRQLLIGLGFSILWAVAVYTLMIFGPVYVQDAFHFTPPQAQRASFIGNFFLVAACFVSGAISDRIGRRKMLTIGAALLLIAVLPLYAWLQAAPTPGALIIVQTTFCILVGTFVGVAPAALSELFPTGVRSTGMSLVYNTAITVFGGFAPALLTDITQRGTRLVLAPAWYVMIAAFLALITLPFLGTAKTK
jgi:MFS transporter, MHS family, proline/betaine transporter